MAYQVTDNSTQHGLITPHGYGVPHRYPTTPGEDSQTALFAELARQLYPTGRAFNIKFNSVFYNLHAAINVSFIRVLEDAQQTINSALPDNENFSEDDVNLWAFRLGLTLSDSISLADKKAAILRKFAYPGNVRPRQNPLFIESQLRLAGFDVYIHENRFFEGGEWVFKTPDEVANVALLASQHGEPAQHGPGFTHGSAQFSVIANLAIPGAESYTVGANLWATFFIGGENLGDYAEVPSDRVVEFKELVLKLKPAHTVAFTFINFI
jgi:hypothetical protein